MLSLTDSLLIITNLYPVPWGVNRASFNKQQFDRLGQKKTTKIVVLLPWTEWLKYRAECKSTPSLKYCPYFYVPKVGRRFVPFFQYLSLLFLLPWIKKQKVDALYSSWGFPDAVAVAMLNKWLKIPFFVKVHGTDVNENTLFPARKQLMNKWLSKANTIFCASKALANTLNKCGISEDKLVVNYNGVNNQLFFPDNNIVKKNNIVFVGSLIVTKGVKELIKAFIEIQKSSIDVSLDIIGEGPLKAYIQNEVEKHKLNIYLHGSIPLERVAEKVRQSSLLVLPSYREGVPNVLLESFASGIPVVATTVGGIPEVVTDDVGILVEPKNSQQIQVAIKTALNKKWDREQILKHANQFDWNKNVEFVLENMRSHEADKK